MTQASSSFILKNFTHLLQTPADVDRLNAFILQLAVQGKLVPQDPNDEPAKTSLKNKGANIPEIFNQDELFDLPEKWYWVHLGDICDHQLGKTLNSKTNSGEFIRQYLRSVNVYWNQINLNDLNEMRFSLEELERYRIHKGDLLILEGGYAGRSAIWPFEDIEMYHQNAVHRLRFFNGINPNFYLFFIWQAYDSGELDKFFTGVAIKHFSAGRVKKLAVPLPPLAEQQRIVVRVEELFAQTARLKQALEARRKTQSALVETAHRRLVSPAGAEERAEAWPFLRDHFTDLTPTPESIAQLRQTILQLAIQGKLVPQNPDDEPALESLKRNAEYLMKHKKENKKLLSLEFSKSINNLLPSGWVETKLEKLIKIKSGNFLRKSDMVTSGNIPVYGGNGITGYHNDCNVNKETIVIGRVGYYCGSVHITESKAWITDNAFITYFSENDIYIKYLFWMLKAVDLGENNNATAQPVISGSKIYPKRVLLPPLAEQRRIVARVEALFALCDRLESRLAKAQQVQSTLAEAALTP